MSRRDGFSWFLGSGHARGRFEDEMDEELRFHIESQIEESVNAGKSPEDARRTALLAFGGMDRTKEECRDTRWTRYLGEFWQDLCYALRGFRNSLGFALTVIGTLAMGLGVLACRPSQDPPVRLRVCELVSRMHGLSSLDPATYAAISALALAVAFLAAILPARQAAARAAADLMNAFRAE